MVKKYEKNVEPFGRHGNAYELHVLPSYVSSRSDQGDTHFSSYEALCNLLEAFNNKRKTISTNKNHKDLK